MKKVIKENFRVIVEPKSLLDFGGGFRFRDDHFGWSDEEKEKRYKDRCDDIISSINRHVDEVGSVYMDYDTNEVCSFCGYGWDTDESGEPQCCQKAIDEFHATTKSTQA